MRAAHVVLLGLILVVPPAAANGIDAMVSDAVGTAKDPLGEAGGDGTWYTCDSRAADSFHQAADWCLTSVKDLARGLAGGEPTQAILEFVDGACKE